MVKILEVVVGVEACIGLLGEIRDVALLAAAPRGRQVKPDLGIPGSPVDPGGIEQLRFRVDPLLSFLPVALFKLRHGCPQILHQVRGDGLGAWDGFRGHPLHQFGAQFLVGQPSDGFSLLQGCVSQFAEGRGRH